MSFKPKSTNFVADNDRYLVMESGLRNYYLRESLTSRSRRGSSDTTVVGVELIESLESTLPRADVCELLDSADRGRPERGFMKRIGVLTR